MKTVTLLALVLLLGCITPVTTRNDNPAPELAPDFGWEEYRPAYLRSSVEVIAFYRGPLREVRTTLAVERVSEDGEGYAMRSRGTGVVVWKKGLRLIVLTAKHVVDRADVVYVGDRGGTTVVNMKTIRVHPFEDIAVLEVFSSYLAPKVEAIAMAKKTPKVGTVVWCVGNTLAEGLVPSFGPITASPARHFGHTLARGGYHALPGNSGGGVFYRGKLIGIVSSILGNPRTKQLFDHVAYHVPVEVFEGFVRPGK